MERVTDASFSRVTAICMPSIFMTWTMFMRVWHQPYWCGGRYEWAATSASACEIGESRFRDDEVWSHLLPFKCPMCQWESWGNRISVPY